MAETARNRLRDDAGWWSLAVVLYVCGDMLTTLAGLQAGGREIGVGASAVMNELGVLPAMFVLKLGVFAVAVWFYRRARKYEQWIPMGIAGVGGVVSVWNALVVAVLV